MFQRVPAFGVKMFVCQRKLSVMAELTVALQRQTKSTVVRISLNLDVTNFTKERLLVDF